MKQKNLCIGIVGALHVSNFGDELLVNVLINQLESIYSERFDLTIVIPFAQDGLTVKLNNTRSNILLVDSIDALKVCDVLIFGGGGYLSEPLALRENRENTRWFFDRIKNSSWLYKTIIGQYIGVNRVKRYNLRVLKRYSEIAKFCSRNKIPYFVFGAGAGPIDTYFSKRYVSAILNGAKSIWVRDIQSLEVVSKLTSNAIKICPDIVLSSIEIKKTFSLDWRRLSEITLHIGQLTSNGERQSLIDFLKVVVNNYKEKYNTDIKFRLLVDSPAIEQELFRKELELNFPSIEVITYNGDVHWFVAKILESQLLLTTKLHTGIVAYCGGIPIISLYAHQKTIRFYEQVKLNEASHSYSSFTKMSPEKFYNSILSEESSFIKKYSDYNNEMRLQIKGKFNEEFFSLSQEILHSLK